jgi:hypothetical protein
LLADLTFLSATPVAAVPGASAWYWSNNVDTLIVQYDSVPFYVLGNATEYAGRNTFQVVLSGVDSSITFQYKLFQAPLPAYELNTQGLKTGIENATGSFGLRVLNNIFPASNSVVKFYLPKVITYQVEDATPAWNQFPENGGFFVSNPCSPPVLLKTDISNVGNMPVNNVSVTGQLLDQSQKQIWKDSANVFSLFTGADSVITFHKGYSATMPGDYTFQSNTYFFTDGYNQNDRNEVELVVVDTTQQTIHLSYSPASSTLTGFSWEGGGGGVGVYFVPPFYPATITSIDYYIAANAGVRSGFTAELLKDNGASGAPGTTIESVSVPKSLINNIPSYHTVTLSNPYVITSGGVYCSWIMNGDSIQLGTDGVPPLSNRNFEYVSDTWTTYRNNNAEDLMIRLNIKGSNTELKLITTSLPDSCSTCTNGMAGVTVSGGTPPYTYVWSPGQQTTSAITGIPGTYTVCVKDAKGCPRCRSVTIANNTAITEISGTAFITINPNPFSSSANININLLKANYSNLSFSIYDIYGREVKAVDLAVFSSNSTIDFMLNCGNELSSGLYFYKLHSSTQILSAGKLMVQ